jgi:DNA-binding transcriptional regulator GbsR (MarR family)
MAQSSLEAAQQLFIRRWGEMAASWGVSRTMAEIHALLFLAPEPLCTDDVMDRLAVSRGSASMNLRDLVRWGLVARVHRMGDRKEYFEAEKEVWQMFETITKERRRRELQPIVETIGKCLTMIDEQRRGGGAGHHKEVEAVQKRLADLLEFCELMNNFFNLFVSAAGRTGMRPLTKALAKLAS